MSEPKLLLVVSLDEANKISVTLGTKHEALLALALRKAQLTVDNMLIENEMKAAESSIVVPEHLIQ